LMGSLGQLGTVRAAASINALVGLTVLAMHFRRK